MIFLWRPAYSGLLGVTSTNSLPCPMLLRRDMERTRKGPSLCVTKRAGQEAARRRRRDFRGEPKREEFPTGVLLSPVNVRSIRWRGMS